MLPNDALGKSIHASLRPDMYAAVRLPYVKPNACFSRASRQLQAMLGVTVG
jgi:hypothetical protein